MTAYGPEIIARIAALCAAEPARESCGFVVRRAGKLEVVAIPNVADRYHEAFPARFPRTSRESYLMDPRAQLRLQADLAALGGEIAAVWHSHVETGAHFSEKDRADALIDGAPVLPGAEYLVFGLRAGKVTEARRFVLEGGAFVEADLG
ncbi:MAG TPA: Mov34/MPN/PAD-1 family protein [Anaeromyxobacteraceae bacterium]|nr:Mov34/MPN/PAD-1 family protein [Anaeromyxobacteraceae bacterium]